MRTSWTPAVSVLTPVYRPRPEHLRAALASVRAQTTGDWEHVLVDDGSADPAVAAVLAEVEADPRVHVVRRAANGGIVAASNDALAAARADLVALLDQDDLLAPEALATMVDAAAAAPDAVLLYSDNAKTDDSGAVFETFRKPAWSPERLRGNMYLAHLTVWRRAAVLAAGGFRPGTDGSQDHDLALRVTEGGARVVAVPEVLYLWRAHAGSTAQAGEAKPEATLAGVRAVADHCARVGIDAEVLPTAHPGFYRLRRRPAPDPGRPDGRPAVSVVVPTRGSTGAVHGRQRRFVTELVRSVEAHRYRVAHDWVVVADTAAGLDTSYLDELAAMLGDRLAVVPYDAPFDFSRKVNLGALHARGEYLCVLNDDMEVVSADWLDTLVAIAQQPDVGAVGCLLRFEDGTLQHGGHLYGHANATHAYLGSRSTHGEFGDLLVDRETVGVTAACLVQRRAVWEEVGGFTPTLPANFNDVDYCLKIRSLGYRVVTAASAQLWHFESRTRTPKVLHFEEMRLRHRWQHELVDDDPYQRDRGA